MEFLDDLMLLKNKYGFDIVDIYQNNVLLVELEDERNRIISELMDKECLIIEESQRDEIIKGRPIPRIIKKTSRYRLYQWEDTKEEFVVRLDDFIEEPKKYNMYWILKTEEDANKQILTFKKEFSIFLRIEKMSELWRNIKSNKEVLFAEYVDLSKAEEIIKKGIQNNLKFEMREVNEN